MGVVISVSGLESVYEGRNTVLRPQNQKLPYYEVVESKKGNYWLSIVFGINEFEEKVGQFEAIVEDGVPVVRWIPVFPQPLPIEDVRQYVESNWQRDLL